MPKLIPGPNNASLSSNDTCEVNSTKGEKYAQNAHSQGSTEILVDDRVRVAG